jgi:hypothetical protein
MRRRTWIPVALGVALGAGPAGAQSGRAGARQTPAPFVQQPQAFQQTPRPFNQQPWSFVPGQGWMPPGGQVVSPFGLDMPRAVSGQIKITPPTGGYGGGYWYYPSYGYWGYPTYGYYPGSGYVGYYSGPVYTPTPRSYGTYLPQSGAGLGTRYVPPTRTATEDRRPREEERKPDREQVRISVRAEELMAQRPFRSGTVVRVREDELEVKLQLEGTEKTLTYPANEVFFFKSGGELTTATATRDTLKPGDRVMVPEPAKEAKEKSAR